MAREIGIYVHWPWCLKKCPYCDFNSHHIGRYGEQHQDDYLRALKMDLAGWKDRLGETPRIGSIFFGGGTPSLMSAKMVGDVINFCADLGEISDHTEITLEANPTSSSKTAFKALSMAGINRLSLGVQGLREEWLNFLGREHSVDDALHCLEDALAFFGNVSADVIYGLPFQKLDEWIEQLDKLAKMGMPHLSAYQLTVEKNTKFFSDVRRGLWQPVDSDAEADFFDATRELLTSHGFDNYEISNFSKRDMDCRYNSHVWRYQDYIGVGAGAHGRITLDDQRVVATATTRQPEGYMERLLTGKAHFSTWKALDHAEAFQEAIFSGLRLRMGIDLSELEKRFGTPSKEAAIDLETLQSFVASGFLIMDAQVLRLSEAGWPRLNAILKRLLRSRPGKIQIAYD